MSPRWRDSWLPTALIILTGLAIIASGNTQSPAALGENLLVNPGFESGITGWNKNGRIDASSNYRLSGCCSASISSTIGWAGVNQTVTPIVPGATYAASGYVLISQVQFVQLAQLQIEWRTSSDSTIGACSSLVSPSGAPSWLYWSIASCIAPPGAAKARLKAEIYLKAASSGPVGYIDDLVFAQTAHPQPTATASSTRSPTLSATPTLPPTPTPTRTSTAPTTATTLLTMTPTRTRTPTSQQGATPTATMLGTPSTTITPSPSPTSHPASTIVINEVEYNPLHDDNETYYEWLELYNPSSQAVTMHGWTISDNLSSDTLPYLTIPPGSLAVIAAQRSAFLQNYPHFSGLLVGLGGPIGNGLANAGDRLILRNASDQIVDALSYGDDATVFAPPCRPVTAEGHSLERRPVGHDTGRASDFQEQPSPSPGQGWLDEPATATVTPTATGSATPTGTATPAPSHTPSATATTTDTPTATPTATLESMPTPLATQTRTPTASISETATPAQSPSATPSAASTAAETTTSTPTRTATLVPSDTATPTAAPSATVIFLPVIICHPPPTPTATATPDARLVSLNEILPAPDALDWNEDGKVDSGDEWVELYNAGQIAMDVSGWALDDETDAGSQFYFLPAGTVIPARGFLLLFGKQTGLNFANTRDVVRLLYRDGALLEEYRYYATWDDRSFSKTADGGQTWTVWYPPSPGQPNRP